MKKALFFSFILVISYLFSMKTKDTIYSKDKQSLNTQESVYLKQHTQILPNPVQDYFYIESTDGVDIDSFVVYDITGKQIKFLSNNTSSTTDIDTSGYEPGIYMLQITSEGAIIFKKLIVVSN